MTAIDAPPLHAALDDASLARLTERVAATARRYDNTGEFPHEGIQAVHEGGYLLVSVGARYGGEDIGQLDRVRLLSAIGRGDPAVALIAAMTITVHAAQAAKPWIPEQLYADILRASRERPVLANTIRAEPEWGAPARGGLPNTTVRRRGDRWILNGAKAHATGVEGLAYQLVWAVTDTDDAETVAAVGEAPRVAHAIVPSDSPGITIEHSWDHLGQRATGTHDVQYTDVSIPLSHFAGNPPQSEGGAQSASALQIPALYLGVAYAAQEFFLGFANTRSPGSLGRPLATLERFQSVAGEIESQLVQAEETLHSFARRLDAGETIPAPKLGVLKLIVTRAAITATQLAVEHLGNAALTRHNPLERHLRNLLPSRVHPPQDDAARVFAGRALLSAWADAHPDAGASLSGQAAAHSDERRA